MEATENTNALLSDLIVHLRTCAVLTTTVRDRCPGTPRTYEAESTLYWYLKGQLGALEYATSKVFESLVYGPEDDAVCKSKSSAPRETDEGLKKQIHEGAHEATQREAAPLHVVQDKGAHEEADKRAQKETQSQKRRRRRQKARQAHKDLGEFTSGKFAL